MTGKVFDVIVVGAGYAGLSASYFLKQQGLDHLVFERGKIGESWLSQRWDSFRLNSTNKLNLLPGVVCEKDEDAFDTAGSLVDSFNKYVALHHLPVLENAKVASIENQDHLFHITVSINGKSENYTSRQVIIASGAFNEIRIPEMASRFPSTIRQLHSGQYRNSDRLPDGAVLVVGSAQSGIQIAFDLVASGRKVFLATSEVGRLPRWYRGRDIFYWLFETKFYDIREEEVTDPKIFTTRPQHITGAGSGRDTISLQSFAKKGGHVLGRLRDIKEKELLFELNAADHIRFADKVSADIKKMIDDHILKNGLVYPEPHFDEADIPDTHARSATNISSLDPDTENISTVIWATGFIADLSYIKLPVFNKEGKLLHKRGQTAVPGLHFLGYPWLFSRKSTILFGIYEDLPYVINAVNEYHSKQQNREMILSS